MQIRYDDEANEVTEMIHRRLRELGLAEYVEGAKEVQAEMEQSLIEAFDKARSAIALGDLSSAIELVLLRNEVVVADLPSGPLELSRDELLRMATSSNPQVRSGIANAILAALGRLAPNDIYTAELPFNVFAALDAMFQGIVVPLRLFDDAQAGCRNSFQADLVVEDETGLTIYASDRRAEDAANEGAFWELTDLVLDRWGLRPRLFNSVIEMKPMVFRTDASDNAFALINNIYLEKVAA
jgi:hypothetical protein